jgi:hypothetical protein
MIIKMTEHIFCYLDTFICHVPVIKSTNAKINKMILMKEYHEQVSTYLS